MNMTSVFAEILVIGIHSLFWLGILFLAIFGYRNFPYEKIFSIQFVVPILSASYILGILIDRFADLVLRSKDKEFRQEFNDLLKTIPGFLEIRFYILKNSDKIFNQLEYTRTRLRIARASLINWLLTLIAFIIFITVRLYNNTDRVKLIIFYSSTILLFSILIIISYKAFEKLTISYIKSTITAYKVLLDDNQKDKK